MDRAEVQGRQDQKFEDSKWLDAINSDDVLKQAIKDRTRSNDAMLWRVRLELNMHSNLF